MERNHFYFSKRTDWELSENKIAQILNDLKKRKTKILDLTVSNPTKLDFDYPQEAILTALTNPDNLLYAPDSLGSLKARQEISRYYSQKGFDVDPGQIFLTASTSEAYSFVFRLLADPQDSVVFPKPSYPLFDFLAELNDLTMETYPLTYAGAWRPDLEALRKVLHERTKAVVVVNPNNPTGSFFEEQDIVRLNKMIKDRNISLVCDEVFLDYLFDAQRDSLSLAGNKESLTFVLGGLSKALGLPQMKLSWIVVNGPDDQVRQASSRLEVIADTYLSVNTPSQNALAQWFDLKDKIQGSIRKRICSNYALVQKMTEGAADIDCLNADGGWYVVLEIPSEVKEEKIVLDLLEKDHVFVHPGYFFDFPQESFLVISLLALNDDLEKGLQSIIHRLETV